jgi:hypothetical protein
VANGGLWKALAFACAAAGASGFPFSTLSVQGDGDLASEGV